MAISGTHHGHVVVLTLLALLAACLSAPQTALGRGPDEAPATDDSTLLAGLAGEQRAEVDRLLFTVSDSLMAPAPAPGPAGERDAVEAAPTETTSGTSPLSPPLLQSTAAGVPEGLPDNDTFRRRLFFIGAPGDERAREPARVLLPPYVDGEVPAPAPPTEKGAATTPASKFASAGAANQAADEHAAAARGPFSALHEKDLLQHRLRPGSRGRPDLREAEIRRAMEGEVFQGPLPESVAVASVVRPGHNYPYRWAVATGADGPREQEQAE